MNTRPRSDRHEGWLRALERPRRLSLRQLRHQRVGSRHLRAHVPRLCGKGLSMIEPVEKPAVPARLENVEALDGGCVALADRARAQERG